MWPKAGRHLIKTSLTGWFDWLIYILIAKWQSWLEYTSSSSRTLEVVSLCLALYLEFGDGVLRTNGISFCLSPLTPSPITFFFVFGSAIARLYLFLCEPLLIMLI